MKIYDFYYSVKQWQMLRRFEQGDPGSAPECYFKGQPYTEMIEKGLAPLSNFDDLVKIGEGTMEDVKIDADWKSSKWLNSYYPQ